MSGRGNWGSRDRRPWGRGRGGRGSWSRGNSGGHRGFRGGRGHNHNQYGGRGFQQWTKTPRDSPGKRLSEEEIGVTEYISDHEGFLGVIKSRYSDFQVSEINLNGEIAKLTDKTVPKPPEDDEVVQEDEDLLLSKYNVEILPMDVWDRINELAVKSNPPEEKVEIEVDGMSKEHRTKIHDAVKKAFGGSIVGSTVNIDDKKLVRFEKYRKGLRIDKRVKWVWPGEYVHFIVHKENCDTMEAANRIAERLRMNIKPSLLGYSGTKDRRAKTTQWFSLRKVDPRKIAAACRDLREIHVGNYSFSATHLKLGMLKGNRFRLALRNVTAPDDSVAEACRLLQDKGFINYYGLQRFGTRVDTPTCEIGRSLIKGDLKEAINLILRPRPGPLEYALNQYVSQGAEAAYHAIPKGNAIEVRLLRSLAQYPNDLMGAINRLARNTRLLYLHSYQSYIWNRVVSERLKRFGLKPAAGDLVPLCDFEETIDEEPDEEEADQDGAEENGDEQNGGQKTETKDEQADTNTDKEQSSIAKFSVKTLTQEDVDSGDFDIFDIVMPLPGNFISYPPNMEKYYEELLTKDGLTLEMKNKYRSFSMSGAYRRIVARPIDVTWSTVRYSSPFEDLIASDLDELNGTQIKHGNDGEYKALLLSMSLPASCYATMALRELLKVDTSGDFQALQNNYHKKDKEEKKDSEKESDVQKEGVEENLAEKRKLESTSEDENQKRVKVDE